MPTLRNYQQQAVDAILNNMDGNPVACLPTGSGKSHVIAELCRWSLQSYPDTRIIVLAHVKELLEQNAEKIRMHWPEAPIGIYCAGLGEKNIAPITVASIQSIYNKPIDETGIYDFAIVDEAHRIPASGDGSYRQFIATQKEGNKYFKTVGLTATPYRMAGGEIYGPDKIFDKLCIDIDTQGLIDRGYLCQISSKVGSKSADMTDVKTRMGDFIESDMVARFTGDIVDAIVNDIMTKAIDRKHIMIYCCSVALCYDVRNRLSAKNIASDVVVGSMQAGARDEYISRFKSGESRILINCDVLTTGFDAPHIDCICILRATQSTGLYVQIIGRGLRIHPDKVDCLILDYGGNIERHGPICDLNINNAGEQRETKICPECGEVLRKHIKQCTSCGYTWPCDPRPRDDDGRQKLVSDSSEKNILKNEPRYMTVSQVAYSRHKKNGSPDSMRVTYVGNVFLDDPVSEWVCLEHSGYAGQKARSWMQQRLTDPMKCPDNVSEALDISSQLKVPGGILIKKEGRYDRIIRYIW